MNLFSLFFPSQQQIDTFETIEKDFELDQIRGVYRPTNKVIKEEWDGVRRALDKAVGKEHAS